MKSPEIQDSISVKYCKPWLQTVASPLGLPPAFHTAWTRAHSHLQLPCPLTYIFTSRLLSSQTPVIMKVGEKYVDLQTEISGERVWVWGTSLGGNAGQAHLTRGPRNSEAGKSQASEELGRSEKSTLSPPWAMRVPRDCGYFTAVASTSHSLKGLLDARHKGGTPGKGTLPCWSGTEMTSGTSNMEDEF